MKNMKNMITLKFSFDKLNREKAALTLEGDTLIKGVSDKDLALRLVLELEESHGDLYSQSHSSIVGISNLTMEMLNHIYQTTFGDENISLMNGDRFTVDTVPSGEIIHFCIIQNGEVYAYRADKVTKEYAVL